MKLDEILNDLVAKVTNDTPTSPGTWCDEALKVNMLKGSLDNDLAMMEGIMLEEEARLIEEDYPASKAKILKTKVIDYKEYLKLKAKVARVEEFVRLAKRRATLEY